MALIIDEYMDFLFDIILPPEIWVISVMPEGWINDMFCFVDQNNCKKPSTGRSIFIDLFRRFKAVSSLISCADVLSGIVLGLSIFIPFKLSNSNA